jgi:hypothetical protein
MAKFRSLSNGIDGLLIVDNYRHLQPIGNRKIYLRSLSSRAINIEQLVELERNAATIDGEEDEDEASVWYYN